MTDRALRDEIELLHAELQAARAKLEEPAERELAVERTALINEVEALRHRVPELKTRIKETKALLITRAEEAAQAEGELADARARVAGREPLGDPLAESKANWERADSGCGVALLAMVLMVALAALELWS